MLAKLNKQLSQTLKENQDLVSQREMDSQQLRIL